MTKMLKLANEMMEVAKENLKRDGSLTPVCMLFYPEGSAEQSKIIALSFKTDKDKVILHKMLEDQIKKTSPIYVLEVIEGWSRELKMKETDTIEKLNETLTYADIEKLDKNTVLLVFAMSANEKISISMKVNGNHQKGFGFEKPVISKGDNFKFNLMDENTQDWLNYGE